MSTAQPARARPRVPAGLLLGILAGTLAAVTVLPSIVPLTWRIVSTEDEADHRQARVANLAVAALHEQGYALVEGLASQLGVQGVVVLAPDRSPVFRDGELPDNTELSVICPASGESQVARAESGNRWVISCKTIPSGTIITTMRRGPETTNFVGLVVAGVAVMVGISTALGVLRVLAPLSALSAALQRVEAGERGVRVGEVGLAELDDLVAHINAATQAMEDREDSILSRIEVVQHLARMVAHEIRNPLQSLELLASLIASESDREEREELARSIQNEVRTLENVVVRLLRDAPGQAALRPTRSTTSIRDLLRHVSTLRAPEARRRGVTLETGEAPDLLLSFDRTLVSRAIENLVTNAIDAVPAGSGRVRMSARLQDSHVVLVVEDNGPGIDPSLGNAIYQANTTTKANGHGLGLALVRGVMLAHEGYVSHDRSDLGGARFLCGIPMSVDAARETSRADPGGR